MSSFSDNLNMPGYSRPLPEYLNKIQILFSHLNLSSVTLFSMALFDTSAAVFTPTVSFIIFDCSKGLLHSSVPLALCSFFVFCFSLLSFLLLLSFHFPSFLPSLLLFFSLPADFWCPHDALLPMTGLFLIISHLHFKWYIFDNMNLELAT